MAKSTISRDRPVHQWLAVASLGLGAFAVVTAEFLPVGLLPEISAEFGITSGQGGLMMTLPGVFAAAAAPGVMLAARSLDRRLVLIGLSILHILACAVAYLSPSYSLVLVSRALSGISLGAFWAMALATSGRLVDPPRAHTAAAIVFSGVTAAMILGVPLGTFIAANLGWRGAFAVTGGIGVIALLMQFHALPRLPVNSRVNLSMFVRAARLPALRKSLTLVLLVFAIHFAAYTYLAPRVGLGGIQGGAVTWLLLAYGVLGFATNFGITSLAARSLAVALWSGSSLLLIAVGLLSFYSLAMQGIVVAVLIWGAAWGILPLCLSLLNGKAAPTYPEESAALFTFVTQTAIAIGSGFGGILVDAAGTVVGYRIIAVAALAFMLMVFLATRRGHASALKN
ncbi:MFS transporter [Xanthomonas citri pv. anacardii]|uniref:MFS transporter n=1 Tax=Xanthomonas citri TaxID=346 RepID=UPI0015E1B7D2|nr:MFS transporter [Xanthomonas citri]MCT8358603.1 MFS transporter [Xanthomonas citri pv. anacardii]MCT8362648.1 MFS transporter [Xanthomonas citri pv. anacardii]MCT8366678.1 MFS transporter [Xanthomonas citri pv. anacardii]MCT8370707.1 MFS transporter [Xanthomonas citri pv. anacardii]MCT8374728.1 MFS transporter [Xanthomonas citri pv. anacardii]